MVRLKSPRGIARLLRGAVLIVALASASTAPAGSPGPAPLSFWFTDLFKGPPGDSKRAAVERIEQSGLDFTADDFVRAVLQRHEGFISLYLSGGMDVNAPGTDGRPAILAAALSDDWAGVGLLLAAGADVDRAGPGGLRAILVAASRNEVDAMRLLLEHGASLTETDAHGHGPLHYAVASRSLDAMHLLLEKGATCSGGKCCDGAGDLFAHACESDDWRIIEPVLKRMPGRVAWNEHTIRLLTQAITAKDEAMARLLISKHATQPAPEGCAQPMLAYAMMAGDLARVKFLLGAGADANTPLNAPVEKSFAQLTASPELREYLTREGGVTALMLAAGLGKPEFIRELLTHGASRGAVTAKEHLPALMFAIMAESAPSMQLLIEGAPSPSDLRIEISIGPQEATVMKYGIPILTTQVSTGKPGFDTPPGEYVITDKNVMHRSTIYKCDMPFFMRLNSKDFGMHEGVVPGYPASHGCIRLPSAAARQLFKELPIGTLVSIR